MMASGLLLMASKDRQKYSHIPLISLKLRSVTLSNHSLESAPLTQERPETENSVSANINPMQEYYQLQQKLLLITLALTGIIFLSVWIVYSLAMALNYLLGAFVGSIYLKLLARDVENVGNHNSRLGAKGLALFAGLIIISSKWQQLHILPVFLGFLTYKVAIVIYMLQMALKPASK